MPFYVNTVDPLTQTGLDADSAPTFRIYEDTTGTPIATGTMTLTDSSNTDGFYAGSDVLATADGYEVGKTYCILTNAVVGGNTYTYRQVFIISAETSTIQTQTDKLFNVSFVQPANLLQVNGYAGIDGLNFSSLLAIIAANAAGEITGSETNDPILKSLDGDTNRITAEVDADGDRTVTVDVTDVD
jgi:hypothetical protein